MRVRDCKFVFLGFQTLFQVVFYTIISSGCATSSPRTFTSKGTSRVVGVITTRTYKAIYFDDTLTAPMNIPVTPLFFGSFFLTEQTIEHKDEILAGGC